jgi:phosphatidylinositol alpha-mannosyltransferase
VDEEERQDSFMKIGMVSPYDWSYPGGVRDHIQQLSSEFMKMGHEVRILAPASASREPARELSRKLLEEHVYAMGPTTPVPINGSIARISWDPALFPLVQDILEREHFDVLHIHEPLVPGLSLMALRLSSTLTVGTFHAFARPGMTSTSYLAYASASPFLRPYFRRLSGRIAVSLPARQFVSHYFPADYRIIPNGVNLERFFPRIAPLQRLRDGKFNILFVGRFERRKGAKYLLRAIPLIREQHPETRFIFVGEGQQRRELQHFTEQNGWPDVPFPGYVSERDLPRYYASADLFCSPATGGESMGIVLLEAMAMGLPIVASNIPGYAAVISPSQDGLLTMPRDHVELAAAINLLLDNPSLRQRLIQMGLRKVQDYAWPHIARRVLDYYYSLLYERCAVS